MPIFLNTAECVWAKAKYTNLRGSIAVWLTSCLFCLDSAAMLMLYEQHFRYLFRQIRTSQTGGLLYSDTFPQCMVSVLCPNMWPKFLLDQERQKPGAFGDY